MAKARFFIHAPDGKGPLSGSLFVFWHGAGGDVDHSSITDSAKQLAGAGAFAARARFGYRLDGRRPPDRMPKLQAHAIETIEAIRKKTFGNKKHALVLGGRSMGGRVASMIAEQVRADALVLLSYPLHTPKDLDKLRDAHLYAIHKPMLFVSGDRDNMARQEILLPVLKKIGKNAELALFAGADHSFRRVPGPDVAEKVRGWAEGVVGA